MGRCVDDRRNVAHGGARVVGHRWRAPSKGMMTSRNTPPQRLRLRQNYEPITPSPIKPRRCFADGGQE
ncbi:hypothetical protein RJT34_04646 [Clitoria ternatea]|uniref:Uncharacterized protein n=1 Tax=Clitoria ternatea TaxID=43366 RepID=A0AAN9KM15_CLITE